MLAISYARYSYYTRAINDHAADNRHIFRLANKLLSPPIPALLLSITNISPLQLRCIFSRTFSNKIDSIIIKIKNHTPTANYTSIIVTPPISAFLSFFHPPYISLISKLRLKSKLRHNRITSQLSLNSWLPLVSKILERIVSRQLISILTANNHHIPQQSRFR